MDFWDALKSWLDRHRNDNIIYLVCLLFGMVASTYFYITDQIGGKSGIIKLVLIWAIILIVCCYLFVSRLFPFAFKNKNCLLLIFQTFDEDDRKVLEKYFVSKIRSSFLESKVCEMKVLFLPEYQTKKFFTYNQEKRQNILNNSGVRMCLWGSARQAKSRGESVYSLDFSIIVWHDDMPIQISQYLSLEMSYVTESVRKVEIPMNDTARKFPELTDSVKYTSDYILACALICTEHFDEAERILEPLNAQVKAVSRNIPTIANLKHVVPAKLCIVYAIQAELAYEEYFKSKNKSYLNIMHQYINKQEQYGIKGDQLYGQKALYYFCMDRDLKKARECINAFHKGKYPGYVCRLDKVFLGLYDSFSNAKLCNAFRSYVTILRNNTNWSIQSSAEEFISDLLETEPERVQLNWLACILTNVRGDYILSQQYLDAYLSNTSKAPDKELTKYIEKIRLSNTCRKSVIE